jgi:hypothetical protein
MKMKLILIISICIILPFANAKTTSLTYNKGACSITNISVPIGGVSGPVISFTAKKNDQAFRLRSIPTDDDNENTGTVLYESPKYRLVSDDTIPDGLNKGLFEQCKSLADSEYNKESYRRLTTSFLAQDETSDSYGVPNLDLKELEMEIEELESDKDYSEPSIENNNELLEVEKELNLNGEGYSSSDFEGLNS